MRNDKSKTFTSPSNFEIIQYLNEESTGLLMGIKDFSQRNIGDLKNFKSTKLENSKLIIDVIHTRLRNDREISGELLHLDNIIQHLPRRLQSVFYEIPAHA
jgi:septum formation inhibitor-activating ATPase MinD